MGTRRGRIVLYWIPVGAGGNGVVTVSARLYELIHARRERRPAQDLLHTALEVHVDDTRFVIECAWPSPDRSIESRGVVVVGPVFARPLGRLRPFRYEIRRWDEGQIWDIDYATEARVVSQDVSTAEMVLELATQVPSFTWGRDAQGLGEMWNSNSVVAFLLAGAGVDMTACTPPVGGRAPGLSAGVAAAALTRPDSPVVPNRDQ